MKTTTKTNKRFVTLKNHPGIRKDMTNGSYVATKCIKSKRYSRCFERLADALNWKNTFVPGVQGHLVMDEQRSNRTLESEQNGVDKGLCLGDVWRLYQSQYFPNLEKSTIETKIVWSKFFTSLLNVPMVNLNPELIDKHIIREKEYSIMNGSPRSNFKNPLNELQALLNWYRENYDYKFVNPILKRHYALGIIKKVEAKKKKMSPIEVIRFLNELPVLYQDFATVQFYAAARVHEIAGMQTFNVRLDERFFLIKHVIVWDKKKHFVELKPYPKNREERSCAMNEVLEEIFFRRMADIPLGCTYLFHEDGKPLSYRKIQHQYAQALKRCGFADQYSGTHIMRHSMATVTRRVTGSLEATQAVTGHKDQKLVQHYAELPSSAQTNAVVSVERFLSKVQAEELDKHGANVA